jgi:hypothetical protein
MRYAVTWGANHRFLLLILPCDVMEKPFFRTLLLGYLGYLGYHIRYVDTGLVLEMMKSGGVAL